MKEQASREVLWGRFLKERGGSERERLACEYFFLVDAEVRRLLARLPPAAYREKKEDLASAGMIGLLQALDHFRPPKERKNSIGRAFEAYARYRIRGRMLDELRTLDFARRNLRRQARRIEEIQERLRVQLGRVPTEEETAKALGWSLEQFWEELAEINMFRLLSLDAAATVEGGSLGEALADGTARDPLLELEQRQKKERVRQALLRLKETEQKVLHLYYVEELTFREIGKLLGVSESRICQIHHLAVFRLQSLVERSEHGRTQRHERIHHPHPRK